MEREEGRRRLLELIEGESTLVLATVDHAGVPHAAPLFYLPVAGLPGEDISLYWLSSPSSRHSLALGQVAVAIHASTWKQNEIRGAQLEGRAELVEKSPELLAAYKARFALGDAFDRAIASSELYRFTPRWVRYLDNAQGFGGRIELTL